MKKPLYLTLSACALAIAATHAQAEVSANVALTSDYVWRGMTQTDGAPALQGGFDYAHESGFYAGTWGSSVEFNDDASMELDLYLGYSGELAGGIGYDLGVIRYMYPESNYTNFDEFYASASYAGFSAGIATSSDFDANYYTAGYDLELPMGIALGAAIGFNDADGGSDATDLKLAISKDYNGLGIELAAYKYDSDAAASDQDGVYLTLSKSL